MYRHPENNDAASAKKYYIVSGGFDPIHEGHIEMIRASAAASDGVILLLNSDEWLCRKKGKNFMNFHTRRVICENLKGVVDVLAFNDDDNSASDGIIKTASWFLPMAVIAPKIIFRNLRFAKS